MPAASSSNCAPADLTRATHPYTRGLLDCLPALSRAKPRLPVMVRDPGVAGMIEVEDLTRPVRRCRGGEGRLPSRVPRGSSLGIVGESGSGKSTILRALVRPERRLDRAHEHRRRPPRAPARPRLLPPRADGVPGPLWLAASAPDRGPRAVGTAGGARHPRRRERGSCARWRRSRCRPRFASAIRTSFPAASASASPSPAP